MLKYLGQNHDWGTVQTIGFDLDGTLYDEYEFIAQVYRPIATILGNATKEEIGRMYEKLLHRSMGRSRKKIACF